jgi:hypothetical protein
MAEMELMPTAEEMEQARAAFAKRFGHSPNTTPDDEMALDRARISALERLHPDIGLLMGNLAPDEPPGFGVIDVGLPKDPIHGHVVLTAREFLILATEGEIVLNEDGYPDYIGTERLRG